MSKEIHVAAGIIRFRDLVFIGQRIAASTPSGLWEFPGGKVEEGETSREALRRELSEEIIGPVGIHGYVGTHTHDYDFAQVRIDFFLCSTLPVAIRPVPGQYQAWAWAPIEDLSAYELAPADIPFAQKLMRGLL